jgi:hypothetical protein
MQDKIKEMADDIYKHSNYSEVMSLEIAKFNVKNNYRKSGGDTVILTKDEFHSIIKTDKEAEEYGQQCWNDGAAFGAKKAAEKILRSLMNTYIKREDLNDNGYGADESITMNDLLELAEQFNVEI